MMNFSRNTHMGFSLIELSIVMVIIGLLTGGIMVGKNLIRASELRSVVTQYHEFVSATHAFRDSYLAIPGDMPNATDYFPSATCYTGAGSVKQTCNGNGNGEIDEATGANQYSERFMFWQHLALANLIAGDYTGRSGTAFSDHSKANAPEGEIDSSLWSFIERELVATNYFNRQYGGVMFIGRRWPTRPPNVGIVTPEEMWSIDNKIDDGYPAKGTVTTMWYDRCTTASGPNDMLAEYDMTIDSTDCYIAFANVLR
tara:strand:- start:1019 stop:1786 length:768 start_codon:yes stop_codon:yes gene_type:complete